MWAQSWGNLFQSTAPYPDAKGEDITKEMKKQVNISYIKLNIILS